MKAIFENFTKEDIKEMVEDYYGVCMWEYDDEGLHCYPDCSGHIMIDTNKK